MNAADIDLACAEIHVHQDVASIPLQKGRARLLIPWLVGMAIVMGSWGVMVLESLDHPMMFLHSRQKEADENLVLEQQAIATVPNYKRLWFTRNLFWIDPQLRISSKNYNVFGSAMLLGFVGERTLRPWLEVCAEDSDGDGYSNGAELGDPCCIYRGAGSNAEPTGQVAWSWRLTHPGQDGSAPTPEIQVMLERLDCQAVRQAQAYPSHDEEFDAFFFEVNQNDIDLSWGTSSLRLFFFGVLMAVMGYWAWVRGLWKELSGKGETSAAVLGLTYLVAYAHNDLNSAFVHAFMDNCHHHHPIIGGGCKGTQFHHHRPRGQSLEPMVNWIGNPIATAPAIIICVVYIYLGNGIRYPRCLQTGFQYPRWFELLVFWMGVTAPLSYFFHQAAHTPELERGWLLTLLQQSGVALSPELHKVHHRLPNGTWSVMAGWMDFVPNWLVRNADITSYKGPESAHASFIVILLITVLPWFMWLVYFTIKEIREQSKARMQ